MYINRLLTVFLVLISFYSQSQEIFVPIRSFHFKNEGYTADNLWVKQDTMFYNAHGSLFSTKKFSFNQWNFGAIYSHKVGKVFLNGGVYTNSFHKPSVVAGIGFGKEFIRLDLLSVYGYPDRVITPLYLFSVKKGILRMSINHEIVLLGLNFKLYQVNAEH